MMDPLTMIRNHLTTLITANKQNIGESHGNPFSPCQYDDGYENGRDNTLEDVNEQLQAILDTTT
jgi:hypothetical protein